MKSNVQSNKLYGKRKRFLGRGVMGVSYTPLLKRMFQKQINSYRIARYQKYSKKRRRETKK